jgi:hypothetical protein
VYPVCRLQIKSEIVVQAILENYSLLPFANIAGIVADTFAGKAQHQMSYGLFLLIKNTKIPGARLLPSGGSQLCDQAAEIRLAVGAAACEA